MHRILVLGASGMLGSTVVRWLTSTGQFEVHATCRSADSAKHLSATQPGVEVHNLDATSGEPLPLRGMDWVVNAIGVIKPYIHDDNRDEVERAIRVNALFPLQLAREAEASGVRVIQIATDCVYSGREGKYVESAPHDATDAYGKTKSLGEVPSPHMTHLRCSIIGPELGRGVSLLSWFLNQPKDASVNGFRNHEWNGITTLHFARLCGGIVERDLALPQTLHVIPGNDISKEMLLRGFADAYGRSDITVHGVDAQTRIDRRLRTEQAEENAKVWKAAGYNSPPSVEQMIVEMAEFGAAS